MKVEWAKYIFDLRIGFRRGGKWKVGYLEFWKPVIQNFWNGIFTLNLYVVKTSLRIKTPTLMSNCKGFVTIPLLIPRVGMVIRYSHDRWFQAGIGYLFDRGEFGAKFVFSDWQTQEKFNPGVNAIGWNEGPV